MASPIQAVIFGSQRLWESRVFSSKAYFKGLLFYRRVLIKSVVPYPNKSTDERIDGWPLMSSPLPSVIICLSYFYFVKVWGPQFMKNRQAYNLRGVLLVYNIFQILLNSWMFYEFSRFGWLSGNYSFICQPVDYSNKEAALRILRACYWFYISKFIDFCDTLFFVLRKKNNQITTLHVLHHGILPMNIWPGLRFTGGGHATFFAFLNTFVHIAMYFYYFLAAMGPRVQKYLGWKKYLTTCQIIQFVAASFHCFQLIFVDCDFPIGFCWWIGCQEVFFLCLFIKFYKHTYQKKKETGFVSPPAILERKKKINRL